jgi:asparagine synthase
MSDFLFSTRRREPGALLRCLEAYLAPVTAAYTEHHGPWGSLAVARGHHDAGVVEEDERSLSVLIGHPLARISMNPAKPAWEAGPDGVRWEDRLDGHFALLGIDKETSVGRVVTDLFSFIPVYAAVRQDAEGTGLVLGTHADAVARAAGRGADIDPVSATDFVLNLTITFPHTLYRGVEQLAPGTERRFDARSGWTDGGRTYWQPVEEDRFASVEEAAATLRDAFATNVREACDDFQRVGLLLSGGEDSRAILGAAPEGVEVQPFIYADWESREVRIARRVARAHGAELVVGRRGPDHYMDGFEAVAAMVGSQHMFVDVHGYGFHDRLGLRDLPVVLGGLSSDSLLKAEYAPPPRSGPRPPVRVLAEPLVRAELVHAVAERRTAFRDRLAEIRPQSADEWTVLYPFSMRKHGGNVHGNRRLFRSHEVYHSRGILEVAAAVPAAWKLHRRLFHLAMRPFFAKTWHVPHTEYRFPYFGRAGNALLLPALGVARGLRALASGQVGARHRPWPKWGRLASSAAAERMRREHPLLDSPLADIFEDAPPERIEGATRRWYSLRRLVLLQAAYLTRKAGSPGC